MRAPRVLIGQVMSTLNERVHVHKAHAQQCMCEGQVLLAMSDELRHDQVVSVEARRSPARPHPRRTARPVPAILLAAPPL